VINHDYYPAGRVNYNHHYDPRRSSSTSSTTHEESSTTTTSTTPEESTTTATTTFIGITPLALAHSTSVPALQLAENNGCPLARHGTLACPMGEDGVHGHYLECVWGRVARVECPNGTVCRHASPNSDGLIMCAN
ncbi:hypothetical protein GGH99_004551, partial [Coemansia sp. RSA 1285]